LVALAPDVILASGSPSVAALQHATRTLPIVFVQVADAVGSGFVAGLAQPVDRILRGEKPADLPVQAPT
jgi:putative ABC transport system substrate-binding protein